MDPVTIPFLKVGVDEAVKALDEAVIKGYKIYYEIILPKRSDYGSGDPNIALPAINEGDKIVAGWVAETYETLRGIYSSQREALNFQTVRPNHNISGLPKNLSSVLVQLECKIENLNRLLDYILHRPNIQFLSKRDLFVQLDSPNSKQEVRG